MKFENGLGRDPIAASPRRARAALGAALACALAAGCTAGTPFEDAAPAPVTASIGEPVDAMPTGSIKPASDAPLERLLAPADHAAVLTALGAALDPQSAGASVTWAAAGGQRRGEARPLGMARTEDNEVCRPFALDGSGLDGKFNATGTACRNKRGDWRVKTLTRAEAG